MDRAARDLKPGDSIVVDGAPRVAASVEVAPDPHGYRYVTVDFTDGTWKMWAVNDKVQMQD